MAFTSKMRKLLHRKAWEMCTPSPLSPGNGAFIVSDKFNLVAGAQAYYVGGVSSIYRYDGEEDAWQQLPSSGAAGSFAAGACGEYRALGAMGGTFTQIATGGTTTTLITNRTILRSVEGCRVRVVAGTGMGYEGTVSRTTYGANSVITVTPANAVAFDATTQFQVYSGSLWFFNPGSSSVGFSVFDVCTNTWTARSVTNLPTAWGTDGQLVSTVGASGSIATGTATAGATTTTLPNTTKAWGTNMWANYQVRITAGTGKGQIRSIASNTATVLTVAAAWTVTPDATSVYSIEGNDDNFYLLGNAAVTLYKFNVSTNTWAALTPVAARAAAMGAGGSANWIESVTGWDNETLVNWQQNASVYRQNGRYIFSLRGGGVSSLDVYDIAANTWISTIGYGNQAEVFTTGTSSIDFNGSIYINKDATMRFFRYDVEKNCLFPIGTNLQPQSTGVTGNKMFMLPYTDGDTAYFLFSLQHSRPELMRMRLV